MSEERLEIAEFLYASLPAAPSVLSEDDSEFHATLQRRMEEMESDKVQGVPAQEVLERLRKKFAK